MRRVLNLGNYGDNRENVTTMADRFVVHMALVLVITVVITVLILWAMHYAAGS
jgi:hypothetical protein